MAKRAAAAAAADAESTLSQLEALAARTGTLVSDYAGRSDAIDGHSLNQIGRFVAGLRGITTSTLADSARARTIADSRQTELAAAERRRAGVEERALREARGIAARRQTPSLGARRAIGTDLE